MTSGQTDHALPTAGAVEEMAWIPGGIFMMGSDHHYPEEAPAHEVAVDGFWIDRTPVTNREFRRFRQRDQLRQPKACNNGRS